MIWTLQHGQVEIRESTAPVTVDGKSYPAGSYVVLTRQPFGNYAKTLLERQQYPDLFEYPGGPPKRPYDVTAHTLPLLFGVDVAHVMGAAPATGAVLKEIPEPVYSAASLGSRCAAAASAAMATKSLSTAPPPGGSPAARLLRLSAGTSACAISPLPMRGRARTCKS